MVTGHPFTQSLTHPIPVCHSFDCEESRGRTGDAVGQTCPTPSPLECARDPHLGIVLYQVELEVQISEPVFQLELLPEAFPYLRSREEKGLLLRARGELHTAQQQSPYRI